MFVINEICIGKRGLYGNFLPSFMALDEIFFLLWMNTEMVLAKRKKFQADFFHKNSHILQDVPKNVLKCTWIVITVAMPLSNSFEVLV